MAFILLLFAFWYKYYWLVNTCRYNGSEGLHTEVAEFERDKDCLVCGPGIRIELDPSITLQKVIFQLLTPQVLFFMYIIVYISFWSAMQKMSIPSVFRGSKYSLIKIKEYWNCIFKLFWLLALYTLKPYWPWKWPWIPIAYKSLQLSLVFIWFYSLQPLYCILKTYH